MTYYVVGSGKDVNLPADDLAVAGRLSWYFMVNFRLLALNKSPGINTSLPVVLS